MRQPTLNTNIGDVIVTQLGAEPIIVLMCEDYNERPGNLKVAG